MDEELDQVAEAPGPPILSLVPYNSAARQATAHPQNARFRYRMADTGYDALYISFENQEKQVFTLGRANCDIFLPDPRNADISKHQCSFLNTEQGAVLLEDKSSKKNTEPYSSNNGGQTIGFRDARRVLVARGINNMIGIGRDRFYQFEIHWQSDGLYPLSPLYMDQSYRTGPQRSRRKRYIEGDMIGGGSFGQVWWVMDVHTGGLMAVKKFHSMEGKNTEIAKREITHMFAINKHRSIRHDHILEILDYSGGGESDTWAEIFMPLKEGNLKSLTLDTSRTVTVDELADMVLHQMLRALKCLAEHKIVHRDLKPENILYEFDGDGSYHLRLGDFGLSNDRASAVTITGTEPFMAPEVYNGGKQTDKVDIWSLFATIVWVKNIDGFQHNCAKPRPYEVQQWLMKISTYPQFADISRMASYRHKDRPSAKRLLRILAKGGGIDDLADSFANGLTLDPTWGDSDDDDYDDDPGIGPSGMPGVPWYEGYVPENYDWERNEEGEGSNAYMPPPTGASPRGAGGAGPLGEARVKPYEQVYSDPDSGTVVPDVWTATPTAQAGPSRPTKSHKGKKKK